MAIASRPVGASPIGAAAAAGGGIYVPPMPVSTDGGQKGQIVRFGNPWHGYVRAGKLHLPNGTTRNIQAAAIDRDTWYVKKPGIAAVTTTPAESAAGMEWRNDAVLSGPNRTMLLGPSAALQLGANRWIFFAPSGKRWLMEASFTGVSYSNTDPAQTVSGTLTVKVISEFGVFPATPAVINQTILTQSLSCTPIYVGADANPSAGNVYSSPRRTLAHSPSGAKALINGLVTHNYRVQWRSVCIWQIDLTEPTAGAVPAAAVSVAKSEAQCAQYAYTETWDTLVAGAGLIRETKVDLILCGLFGDSETPVFLEWHSDFFYRWINLWDVRTHPYEYQWEQNELFVTVNLGSASVQGGYFWQTDFTVWRGSDPNTVVGTVGCSPKGTVPGDVFLREISNNTFLLAGGQNNFAGHLATNLLPISVVVDTPDGTSYTWRYQLISPGQAVSLPGETINGSSAPASYGAYPPLPGNLQYSWDMRSNTIRQCDGHI